MIRRQHQGTRIATLAAITFISAHGAAEPPAIGDPCELQILGPADLAGGDVFGNETDLRGDLAIVSSVYYGEYGAAFIYRRSGTTWVYEDTVEPFGLVTQPLTLQLSGKVAIQGDVAIAGFTGIDINIETQDYVCIYRYDEGTGQWQDEKSIATTSSPTGFVFASECGLWQDRVAVFYFDTYNGVAQGFVDIYRYNPSNTQWELEAPSVLLSDPSADIHYWGISFKDDLLVFQQQTLTAPAGAGEIRIFRRNGSGWDFEASRTALAPKYADDFGLDMDISGDRILVGAQSQGTNGQGRAYLFTNTGLGWSSGVEIASFDPDSYDRFGKYVAISGDSMLVGTS